MSNDPSTSSKWKCSVWLYIKETWFDGGNYAGNWTCMPNRYRVIVLHPGRFMSRQVSNIALGDSQTILQPAYWYFVCARCFVAVTQNTPALNFARSSKLAFGPWKHRPTPGCFLKHFWHSSLPLLLGLIGCLEERRLINLFCDGFHPSLSNGCFRLFLMRM